MAHVPFRTVSRRARGLAVAVALGCVATLFAAQPASAYVPEQDLFGSVYYRLSSNPSVHPKIFDADGLFGPDGTPDGQGAFWFFGTLEGTSAMYAHRVSAAEADLVQRVTGKRLGTIANGIVYWNVLPSWAARGWENGYGYPVSDPGPADIPAQLWGCRAGDRAQWFSTIGNYPTMRLMCLTPGGTPRWYAIGI